MADWDNYEEGGMIGSEEQRTEEVNRKVIPVFFLIDVSESMSCKKIDILNNSMEAIMHDLSNMNNADVDIKYGVLTFGKECNWITANELKVWNDIWSDLQADDGKEYTCFNTACIELNKKLSLDGNAFLNFATEKTTTPPVIILFTDGYASDGDPDGKDGIEELKKNKYFKGSYKLAIAIGDDANQQLCENFTGQKEFVFTAYNEKALRNMIDTVIKDSIVVSSSGTSDSNNGELKDKIDYYIDDIISDYDQKINICKCQYGKTLPSEALDAIYEIEYRSDGILCIKNSSASEQEVLVHLKPGGKLEVKSSILTKLFYKGGTVEISKERFNEQGDEWDNSDWD